MLEITKTKYEDIGRLSEIFSYARKMMAENGNPSQWKDSRPSLDVVRRDIDLGNSYVVKEDGRIVATFAFIVGVEPTYLDIDGEWLDDAPYGTIHRIASDGTVHGIFGYVLNFAESFGVDIRIDTHKDNRPMLHAIEKNGFVRCGVIIVDDGTPREAFQKKVCAEDE
jgi:hypothetical protein